ncbi:hypothetical protein M5689_001881 [Euphorbia peplus]|nr:hypothetical protein M5689_001881 [Euphorbia peplus]
MHYPFPVNGDHEETNVEEQVHQPINRRKNHEDVQQTRISRDKSPLPFSRYGNMKQGHCRTQSEDIVEAGVSVPRKVVQKSMRPSSSSRPHEKVKQENGTRLPRANGANRGKASSSCTSNDLSFSVVMKATHVHGFCRMAIPIRFANKYFKKSQGNIVLKSEDGKAWFMQCMPCNATTSTLVTTFRTV